MTPVIVTKDDALNLLEALVEVAGDDPAELPARRAAFDDTWRKAERGVQVTGATTIAKLIGDTKIVGTLYTLLAASPDIEKVDAFVTRFPIWEGRGDVLDLHWLRQGVLDGAIMKRAAFRNSFGQESVEIGGKRKLLAEMLFDMGAAIRVRGVTFEPNGPEIVQTAEGDKVNTWGGFAIEPWHEPVHEAEVGQFLLFLRDIICAGDYDAYIWMLSWIADIFQDPGNKPKTAPVLVGKPGVGKSFFGEMILRPLIGNQHSTFNDSVDTLVTGFNSFYANRLLIQCEEATRSSRKSDAALLKNFITNPEMVVNTKFLSEYRLPNHARLIFTSNEREEAVRVEEYDRRYAAFEVSDREINRKREFWVPFANWVMKPDTRPKMLRYLLDYEYDKALITTPYHTAAKTRMQQASMPPLDAYMAEWLARNHLLGAENHLHWSDARTRATDGSWEQTINRTRWPDRVAIPALYRDYQQFLKSHARRDNAPGSNNLMRRLSECGVYDPQTRKKLQHTVFDPKTDRTIYERPNTCVIYREDVVRYLRERYGFESKDDNDE